MNLFTVNDNPVLAAYNLPDKLVCKMPLENAQLVATAFSSEYLDYGGLRKKDGDHYRVTHKNHPCSKWTRECNANVAWTVMHGFGLCAEYHRRYGKIHACLQAHLDAKRLFENNGGDLRSWTEHTPFVRAINGDIYPEIRHNTPDTVEAYRQYLHHKHYAKWKLEERTPSWWDENLFRTIHE